MRRPLMTVVATAALATGLALSGTAVASAVEVGSEQEASYPGVPVPSPSETPGGDVQPSATQAPSGGVLPAAQTQPRATLPFTGGELLLVAGAGTGAVGAGAALLAATRRRGARRA